ncbi:MAG: hypothetical protein ACJ788_23575, partial [Ktedonobacteraceae bacterium]
MTRDYNKQRRDDVRPFSRNQSTDRYRNEHFSRPARPRLNRETVDRAWEAGASTNHPDYRPRRNNPVNEQASRDNRHYHQSSEHSPTQNGRKPFGNRQDNNRRFERTPANNSGFRSRPVNSDRGRFDNQRTNEYRQRPDDRYNHGNRPDFRDNTQPSTYERRSPYRDNDQNRGFQRHDNERYDRQPREFGRDNRFSRNSANSRGEFGRNGRSPRSFERGERADYKPPTRGNQNPRWQSRPTAQRDHSPRRHSQNNGLVPESEQFEGDYERFSAPAPEHHERAASGRRPFPAKKVPEHVKPQPEERHVTRLPDGRVLKGPRPVQRRNAEFWNDVAQETEDLIDPVVVAPPSTEEAADQKVTVDDAEVSGASDSWV